MTGFSSCAPPPPPPPPPSMTGFSSGALPSPGPPPHPGGDSPAKLALPPPQAGRDDLLAAIRGTAGKQMLRKVTPNSGPPKAATPLKLESSSTASSTVKGGSLASALQMELQKRKEATRGKESDDEDDDDDEWN
ncbi:hypothetical protein BDZ91DRAFT_715401 [Kalaharituber pfeilii]|nr:hypothetical protein BDZ91DRAFT_715401 [Kalaharituber pfeilii]